MPKLEEYKHEMYAQHLAAGQRQATAEINAGLTREDTSKERGEWRFGADLWNRVREIRTEQGAAPLDSPELEKQANNLLVAMRGEEIMRELTGAKS